MKINVGLSDTKNPAMINSRKSAKSLPKDKKGTSLLKTKQTELDLKRRDWLYLLNQIISTKIYENIFLKLQQRIKESFILKCLDKIKSINTQSERIDSENQDLEGDQMTVNFLLSIY